jgi:hypothetical protein
MKLGENLQQTTPSNPWMRFMQSFENAALYIECNPALVKSITSFPTSQSHSDMETVQTRDAAATALL